MGTDYKDTDMELQHYTLGDSIGSGAMGIVYKAVDNRTGQIVAIKALKPELARYDDVLLERFKREGQALRELNHPNIVALLDVFEEDENHFLVMEYIPDGDLAALIAATPDGVGLPLGDALKIALELADALTRTHHLDVIHRDLKPANVLIATDGTPRLTDFGIAHLGAVKPLTQTHQLLGTIAYLSPEACGNLPIDHRADIWAFGVVLYEMLSGRQLFAADSFAAILTAILNDPLPDLVRIRADMPDALADLLYRMLERSKEARIPSMRLVGAELESIIKGGESVSIPQQLWKRTPATLFAAPKPDTEARRHNLPTQTTTFVGRQHELSTLSNHLSNSDNRLITLLGPGGIGKTRLAIETAVQQADEFADGAYFVPLASLALSNEIPFAVASALDIQIPAGNDPYEILLEVIKPKALLLVMDNFEHVLDGVSFVHQLMQDAPNIKIIVTSRERLSLQYEMVYTVGELSFPAENEIISASDNFDALTLFTNRARKLLPDFTLEDDETRRQVSKICQLINGHPLALGLAASWVRILPLPEIVEELERSLDFLTTTMHDVAKRHRGLRASFEYSWTLLTATEQTILMKLAVFRGGFTRQAAKRVVDLPFLTFSRLIDKSLVQMDANGRYSLHKVIQEFLLEKLSADPQQEYETHSRHWLYYADFLAQQKPLLRSSRYGIAVARIGDEFTNIQAGWYWALAHEQYDEIEKTLHSFWNYLSENDSEEGRVMIQKAAESLGSDNLANGPVLLWKIMAIEIYLVGFYDREEVARKLVPPVLEYVRHHSVIEWDYLIYVIISWAEFCEIIDRTELDQFTDILLTDAKKSGDAWTLSRVLQGTGWTYLFLRKPTDLDKAEEYLNASLEIAIPHDFLMIQTVSLWELSVLEWKREHYQTALRNGQSALELSIQLGVTGFAMTCCNACIAAAIELNNFEQSRQYICQLVQFPNAHHSYWKQMAMLQLADLLYRENDGETAVEIIALCLESTPAEDIFSSLKALRSELETSLSTESFNVAFRRGKKLKWDVVIRQLCEQVRVENS